jgi:hypothetical protein
MDKINISYFWRVLRLTLLASDITETLLDGRKIADFKFELFSVNSLVLGEARRAFQEVDVAENSFRGSILRYFRSLDDRC